MENILIKSWSMLFLLLFCQYINAGKIEDNTINHLMLINKKIIGDQNFEKSSNIKILFDSLSATNIPIKADSTHANLSYLIAVSLYNSQKYDVTIKYLFEMIPLLRKQLPKNAHTEKILINLSFLLSASYQAVGLWDQSIDLQYKLLSVALHYGLDTEQAVIYNNISSVMFKQKDYSQSVQTILKAIEINEHKKDKEKLFVNYNNMSAALVKLEKYDQAIEYAFLAIHQLAGTKDKGMVILVQRNIASIYLTIQEYSLAEKYLKEVENYQIQHKLNSHLAITYKIMGDLRARQKQLSSAEMYYEKALSVNNTSIANQIEILRNYAQFCKETGNINKTYALLEKYIQLKDSISSSEDKNKFSSIASMYLEEQRLRSEESDQLQSITHSLNISKRIIYIMIALLVGSISLVFYIYNNKSKKLNKRINEQSRQLVSFSLDIMQKEEFTSSLADELVKIQQELEPRNNDLRTRLRSIISTILKQNNDDKNSYFENMNSKFYKALLDKYPLLTSKDLRLCVLLRLGLSTKEIADITCKEIRSVESARNRLRRKCELSQEVDLFKFFNHFL